MIPREVLKEIRRIQITTSRMVTDVFAGQYQSVFKGKGMEFDEVREYLPGDDVRSIDWNVTARMGHPFVKKFTEERELTVMLLLDKSASASFGTVRQLKINLAAQLCSLLALAATRNNDKVGLVIFTDRVETFIPARKGIRHVLRVIREALYFAPRGRGTDINAALDYLNKVTTRKCVAFVISDFFAPEFKKSLAIANRRHDLIAITVTDPRELELPDVGIAHFEDPETGELFTVDTTDAMSRQRFRQEALQKHKDREFFFRSLNVDTVDVRTDIPYLTSLVRFFKEREKRLR